ncbi:uncharacterized protein SAPINGB_P005903 [Magnusiomyces paraingens]|uniref:Spindle pole body component n=1 Tax=Magnusiomyces paraingens TaxID=2606893 RepID=A0A5E8C4G0_9ASCO|nr:uncharacterized protein SAPINGB_P005903 [Saprochaete ingens]VVT57855.1 unnamed protein product [Saprochaete ingens]
MASSYSRRDGSGQYEGSASQSRTSIYRTQHFSSSTRRSMGSSSSPPVQQQQQQAGVSGSTNSQRQNPSRVHQHHGSSDNENWIPRVELARETSSALAKSLKPLPKYSHAPSEYRKYMSLEGLSLNAQEAIVIEDLIYVLLGCEGIYIRFNETYEVDIKFDRLRGPQYQTNRSVPISMRDAVKSITDTARHHLAISEFVDVHAQRDYGQVNQALCASIRRVLKDYNILIAQLENELYYNQSFSLQTMQLQLAPLAHILKQIYDLCQVILQENTRRSEEAAAQLYSSSDIEKVIESLKVNEGTNFSKLGLTSREKSMVCKGGAILRILAERLIALSGDPPTKSLLETLLRDASKPYLVMLQRWIHRGIITDPYDEFLICEKKSVRKNKDTLYYTDEYWDKRYTVREDDLPLQLSSSEVYERILLTGKYLNVVRECGGVDVSQDDDKEYESIEDSRILMTLARAYSHANETLLSLLIHTHKLPERLRSLKHFFFLDKADYLINFMDIADAELNKPTSEASKTKLQYLLDMALRQPGSISATDPYRDDVLVEVSHMSNMENLLKIATVPGMDPNRIGSMAGESSGTMTSNHYQANNNNNNNSNNNNNNNNNTNGSKHFQSVFGLQLDFNIPFPLSLVFSRRTMIVYQLMFRHLVELKYIERTLNKSWVEQMKSKVWQHRSQIPELEEWKASVMKLRERMLYFIHNVLYYCTTEINERQWARFIEQLGEAKNADWLMAKHVSFLSICMKECMLTNPKLLRLQSKLYTSCRLFAEYLPSRERSIVYLDSLMLSEAEREKLQRPTSKNGEEMTEAEILAWLNSSLHQYEASFDHHLKILIEALNHYAAMETTSFLSLSSQLEAGLLQMRS